MSLVFILKPKIFFILEKMSRFCPVVKPPLKISFVVYNERVKLSTEQKNKLMIVFVSVVVLATVFWLFFFWWPDFFKLFSEERTETQNEGEVTEEVFEYLREEEAIIIESEDEEEESEVITIEKTLFEYIEVVDGCGPYFEGECLNVRSGPGSDFRVVAQLRNGQVLKVGGKVEREDRVWYKIVFDEWIRYPERVSRDWYVASDYVRVLLDEGAKDLKPDTERPTDKRIVVVRSEQKLYAYENGEVVMEFYISTGIKLTPTPRGEFKIFRKTPSRYMQGPLPGISWQYWDLPGVPWNLYFTQEGAVIHGAYWHDAFGSAYSNGCVNVRPDEARKLYNWAELGTKVIVRD